MKPLGSFENPVNATVTLNGAQVGTIWGASFYTSKQVPKVKRKYKKIIGQRFTQNKTFYKRIGLSKKFKRPIFYREEITIVKRGSRASTMLGQGVVKRPAVYVVSVAGQIVLAGGVTYHQLKKYFTPV